MTRRASSPGTRWQRDDAALAVQTKPHFARLHRWVEANWRREGHKGGFFVGPEAERLMAQEGTQLVG